MLPMTDVMGANGGKKAIREALLNLLENYESGFELFNSKEQLIELELDDLFGTHPALPEKRRHKTLTLLCESVMLSR